VMAIAADELGACAELAEATRVRRAVLEREAQELEEREEDAERMKRARWAAERGELAAAEESEGPDLRSAPCCSKKLGEGTLAQHLAGARVEPERTRSAAA